MTRHKIISSDWRMRNSFGRGDAKKISVSIAVQLDAAQDG